MFTFTVQQPSTSIVRASTGWWLKRTYIGFIHEGVYRECAPGVIRKCCVMGCFSARHFCARDKWDLLRAVATLYSDQKPHDDEVTSSLRYTQHSPGYLLLKGLCNSHPPPPPVDNISSRCTAGQPSFSWVCVSSTTTTTYNDYTDPRPPKASEEILAFCFSLSFALIRVVHRGNNMFLLQFFLFSLYIYIGERKTIRDLCLQPISRSLRSFCQFSFIITPEFFAIGLYQMFQIPN